MLGNKSLNDTYVPKVFEKYASKIIKEQITIDDIFDKAVQQITSTTDIDQQSDKIISEEWLEHFQNVAKIKSSEEMRIVFSKILANEIIKPGSYSLRTLNVTSQLDKDIADIFQKICSIGISFQDINNDVYLVFVPNCNVGKVGVEDFKDFDIYASELLYLEEYGLINSLGISNNFAKYIKIEPNDEPNIFFYNNKARYLKLLNKDKEVGHFLSNGIAFTHAGAELYNIIYIKENLKFTNTLMHFFSTINLEMVHTE